MTLSRETSETIRETLQFVLSSDIASKHKGVLINVLTDALRNADQNQRAEGDRSVTRVWTAHEERIMLDQLRDKTAKSWQHADELVMRVASQLHRSLSDVRQKATALGAGLAVDYRLAKSQKAARGD